MWDYLHKVGKEIYDMVDFKTSGYFSGLFIFLGIFLALIGPLLLFLNLIPGLVILLVSVLILTTHYRLAIDFQNHEYNDICGFWDLKKECEVNSKTSNISILKRTG